MQDDVLVEAKCVRHLDEYATAQVLSCLRSTGLRCGLLINFSHPRLVDGIKRYGGPGNEPDARTA